MKKKLCPNCRGNGFTVHYFEAEEATIQCKVCKSEGELDAKEYFSQTYTDSEGSTAYYVGPILDRNLFKNLKIILE